MGYIDKGRRDILIIPKLENIDFINKVRREYDSLYKILPPHITLAYPFEDDISNIELKSKLEEFFSKIEPFDIEVGNIHSIYDKYIDEFFIMLDVLQGKDEICGIHDLIYKEILPEVDISKYSYFPHITLGSSDDREVPYSLDNNIKGRVNKILVEEIGDEEESIKLFEIDLGKEK